MAAKVKPVPILTRPGHNADVQALLRFDIESTNSIFQELLEHATRLNIAFVSDGTERMTGPIGLASYAKAALPDPAVNAPALIYVTDDVGGAVPAFSDGTNWRRVTDRAVIS